MNKWVVNRVGLLNFWYYQNQIFELADGRMLLRGTNGSGKSLTMQSLFPVLFDGDTSANRLDSFGSRDRKMEDYLLGEKGVSDRDEGIGYLFLEMKRENREEYMTIGIGLNATRGGRLTKWFFAIENNQRIGIDFELYEELRKDEIAPLTKKKLVKRLHGVGRIFETQREYKHFVNERIFGFSEIEQFDELIALLINLRSPKLSKDFRPSVIYGILRGSLPKLKDDELITLAKTIEQLDGHRERLENLSNEISELAKFTKTYKRCQDELFGQISNKWLKLSAEKRQLSISSQEKEKKRLKDNQDLLEKKTVLGDNQVQLLAIEQSIQELSQHEGMNLVQRGQELTEQLRDTQRRLEKNQEQLKNKQEQLRGQERLLEKQQLDKKEYEKELSIILIDNQQYLPYLSLEELDSIYSQKIQEQITKEEHQYWQDEVQKCKKHFQEIIEKLRQLELLRKQLADLSREAATMQQQVDELDRDLRQWQETRQVEVENWKESIEHWRKTATFKISDKHYSELLYRIDQLLEEEVREEVVLSPLRQSYEEARDQNQQRMVPLKNQLQEIDKQKTIKEVAIKEWQDQKMPEPARSTNRILNRQGFAEETLYLSFYQGVDFLASVTQKERNNIEGALLASGILDALISSSGLILADDQQIMPQPKYFSTTLADFLSVNQEIDHSLQPLIADILQSIVVDEVDGELPAVFRDGTYQIANLKGAMPKDYQASYIGVASQERYRQEMILKLKAELAELADYELEWTNQLKIAQNLELDMKSDYESCPRGGEVYQSIRYLNEYTLKRQTRAEHLEEKEKQVNQIEQQVNGLRLDLHAATTKNNLPLKESAYQEAVLYAENYSENLRDAYSQYSSIQTLIPTIANLNQNLAILAEEIRDFYTEQDEGQAEGQKLERLVVENLKQQTFNHVEELQLQLANAKTEQAKRRNDSDQLTEELTQLNRSLATTEHEQKDLAEKLRDTSFNEKYWHKLLEKKINQVISSESDLKKIAKEKVREVDYNKIRNLENNVLAQFSYISEQLGNYNPKLLNAVGIEVIPEEERELGEFAQYNHYKEPRFTTDDQSSSAIDLLDKLTHQQLTLRDLLKKDDEELFKTIILESVGTILRSRIKKAMEWVEQMNQLLQSQKNSSGLSLSIQWKAIPRNSEQDLGTNKLVELLEKPVVMLSEADRNAISRHFQEKVYYAQEQLLESKEDQITLFQAIAQALDYRDWFEFEMKFKRANEGYNPQVLSDRKFNQFSGGEKAISMYLPLFAAVYSRYGDAAKDCPKVITLDEAFAGIDDENIAELFKACEQLGFNYVMNSQALFGDYPTVSSLMIYELLRPQNINLVSAIRYYWDGHRKQILLEENDE